ncbi:MAG: recombination-associated protein RdgC [Candidatus Thiodiazotropha sp.]
MWFKNLQIHQLQQPFNFSADWLETPLNDKRFTPCETYDVTSTGWTSPVTTNTDDAPLAYETSDCLILCTQTEEKIIPRPVVNAKAEKIIQSREDQEGRKLSRKERKEIQEDTFQKLLPQAFSRYSRQYALIDKTKGWLLVDATSANKAETQISFLRETLGSLKVRPIQSNIVTTFVLTEWLKNPSSHPKFVLHDSCELKDLVDTPNTLRCKGQDLTADEILAHLDTGKRVTKLAVEWDEALTCVIDSDLSIKRINILDALKAQAFDHEIENEQDAFDAQVTLMILTFRNFLPGFFSLFEINQQ